MSLTNHADHSELQRSATPISETQDATSTEYQQLLEQYSGLDEVAIGEVVPGRVLEITPSEVIVDIGYKSEGMIPIQEFANPDGSVSVQVGDEINVLLESAESRDGYVVLSRAKAERMQAWDVIENAFATETAVMGVVVDRTKGGLTVDIGINAFLPGSQVDLKPVKDLDSLKGQTIECKVIKLNRRRGNVVLSRKAVLEKENAERKKRTLAVLQEGAVLQGIVKNLTDYGVFVDLGGIDGLLHITDISWKRVNHPSEVFEIGMEIPIKILKFDREKERVSLGYKQLTSDPWLSLHESLKVGSKVRGKVVSFTDYGAFLEIEEGVEGLLHVSELSWNKRIKNPQKVLTLGETVEAVVLDINIPERRLSLGMKQLAPDPWTLLPERFPVGTVISGRVRNLTDFGAFVEVIDGIDGLVHISDMTWTRKIKHPSEVVRKGDTVEAVILNIDCQNHRLSLGMKQLQNEPWEAFFGKHQTGDELTGTVVRATSFGVFVELEGGIEGLCHVSQIDQRNPPAEGESLQFRLIKLQPNERKIGLSLKSVNQLSDNENTQVLAAKASAQQSRSANDTEVSNSKISES